MTQRISHDDLRAALVGAETTHLRAAIEQIVLEKLPHPVQRRELLWEAFVRLDFFRGQTLVGNYKYDPATAVERLLDEMFWEWIRNGLAIPEFGLRDATATDNPVAVQRLRFTEIGKRALRGTPEHPLSAGFRSSLASLDEEARARLEDAAACFSNGLLRAAVVMVGLAYERVVLDAVKGLGVAKPAREHAQRLTDLLRRGQGSTMKDDLRRATEHAMSVARVVSEARNRAAHPGAETFDRAEVEDLIWKAPRWLRLIQALPTSS